MTEFSLFRRLAAPAAAVGFLLTGLGQHATATAGEQPNLLVVGEDADQDTIPRGSRIFNRVLAALTEDMSELGFKVYDETAVGMDITKPGHVRRSDAELISIAQRIPQPPIDTVVAFQVYAAVQQNPYSDIKELRVRIAGRMVQVQTGRALGNFEAAVGPRGLKPLPLNCNRDCILEHVGNEARPIAHEVGIILARKLDDLSPVRRRHLPVVTEAPPAKVAPPRPLPAMSRCSGMSTAYMVVLRGFDPDETGWIERQLMSFNGYEHHRSVRSQTRFAEYWYETCSDQARLERNLRILADQVDGQGRVAFAGNRFDVEKVAGVARR